MARKKVDPITQAWKKAIPVSEWKAYSGHNNALEVVDRQRGIAGEWTLYRDTESGKHYMDYKKF